MNAPIMAALTDIHTVALARFGVKAVADAIEGVGEVPETVRADMASPFGSEIGDA
jgi:hypothetical protein